MRWTVVAALLGVSACGGETGRDVSWSDPFCADVQPRVDAYLAAARQRTPAPSDDRYGGTAVVGAVAELTGGLSPVSATDILARQFQQFALLMTLVRYDAQLAPQPYLARSWEVDADTSALTFHLRDDVYWHDGVRTDARDVVFTYRLVTDPRSGFPNPGYWDFYDTSETGIEALDDFTVRVRLRPHVDFMDPWRVTAILPEHLLGEVAPDAQATHPFTTVCPVGNGPFAFREHAINDRWVFDANPAFPQALGGRPFADRLVYRIIPEQTTLLTELLTGGVDVYPGVLPDQAERVEAASTATLESFPTTEFAFVAWNSRRPQLADARVRRALTMAIDRDEIVDGLLHGHGVVAHSGVSPIHWAYDPDALPTVPFDPEGARRLLDGAGWRDRDGDGVRERADGTRLAITLKYNQGSRQRQQIAEILQARLSAVGVEATPTVVEASALGAQVFDPSVRDYDAIIFAWVHDFRLDESDLFHSERIDGPFALGGTRNAAIDRLLDTLQLVPDKARARPLWNRYQRLIIDEQPFTYLFFLDRLVGTSRRLRGAVVDARGSLVGVHDWWLEPGAR